MIMFSIIIPGYNTPDETWNRCLSSVLQAISSDTEIICIDDGSQRRPRINVEDARIRWVFMKKNGGQSAARNRGLDEARGKYVTFVDSDDEVVPGIYSSCITALEKTEHDISVFGVRTVYESEGLCRNAELPERNIPCFGVEDLRQLVERRLFDEVWNKVFRRDFLNEYQIRFPEGICPGEDTMFVLSCILHRATWSWIGGIGYLYYRSDGTTLSRYLPNYEATLWYWKVKWDEYLSTEGKGYDGWWPTKDFSEEWVAARQWENMWRRGSTISLREKWNYLGKHPELAKAGRSLTLGIKFVTAFFRFYFYIRLIRRWHLKQCLPGLEELKVVEVRK